MAAEATATEVSALWRHLESEPADGTAKAALADALIEAGDPDTAATVKWLLERRLWPKPQSVMRQVRLSGGIWTRQPVAVWLWHYGRIKGNRQKPLLNYLEAPLFEMTRTESESLPEAVAALTDTFRRLWSLIPPQPQ